ncbi:hypothetical protein V22_24700 [Calycomorphotria hydatis]|uniref:Uncharacterized protein n=1 Tax=Calycomorphotria hydatis TaxID=2528027 RepID=A0A517TA38_9PLAN|nr:hypothetical protein V22_24700 [Calycomorphotria hydatis]
MGEGCSASGETDLFRPGLHQQLDKLYSILSDGLLKCIIIILAIEIQRAEKWLVR